MSASASPSCDRLTYQPDEENAAERGRGHQPGGAPLWMGWPLDEV